MNTNKPDLYGFPKKLHPCSLDESSLSIGSVKFFVRCKLPSGKSGSSGNQILVKTILSL